MFSFLSNQSQLLKELNGCSEAEFTIIRSNLIVTIKALNQKAEILLLNRKRFGSLLPVEESNVEQLDFSQVQALTPKDVLLSQASLRCIINSFCLTEAIIVRNNFYNCLESINAQESTPLSKHELKQPSKSKRLTEKNNVSPIRLTEIKQRLAQATISSDEKAELVRRKLNKILSPQTNKVTEISSKQA